MWRRFGNLEETIMDAIMYVFRTTTASKCGRIELHRVSGGLI